MTTLEVKAELKKSAEATAAYRAARDKADRYGDLLSGGRTHRYDISCCTHSGHTNAMEISLCRLADYEAEADRLLAEMNAAHAKTEKIVAAVPDRIQREVLTRRYIIGQQWEDIAECMNYSLRRITQLHGIALKNIALNFPELI